MERSKKHKHRSVPSIVVSSCESDEHHSDMSLASLSPPSKKESTENVALTSLSSPSIKTWTLVEPQTTETTKSPTLANRRMSATISERMIFVDYADGLMNKNRRAFDYVNFCFRCDRRHDMRRSRSTSSIGSLTGPLVRRIEKTGEKFRDGFMVPVYRDVFLCNDCVDEIDTLRKKNIDQKALTVRITQSAMAYF